MCVEIISTKYKCRVTYKNSFDVCCLMPFKTQTLQLLQKPKNKNAIIA